MHAEQTHREDAVNLVGSRQGEVHGHSEGRDGADLKRSDCAGSLRSWSLPHQAPPGGFVDRAEAGS